MIVQGKYTLRRAAGGTSHFARVELVLSNQDCALLPEAKLPEVQLPDVPSQWVEAASRGAAYAQSLVEANQEQKWTQLAVTLVEGTIADTSDDTVWSAGAMAWFDAVGLGERAQAYFDVDRREWGVQLLEQG